jgi:glucose/arabinose dehydrogenase
LSALVSTQSEEGLLGLAFPPDYASSGFAYVYYTDLNGDIRIVRYTRSSSNPHTLNTSTAFLILMQAHPNFQNHDGGTIRFGPSDGYLYAGLGDGGSGNDPNQNAQNPNILLGKMIRIDPRTDDFPSDPNRNYHIPADNPFVDGIPIAARGEIWDLGLRNPWKWSFDTPVLGGTGALVIADVGQDAYEEIDFEHAATGGINYGWRLREGAHDTGLGGTIAFTPLTDPIYDYVHYGTNGNAITGGYIYRGTALGTYWNNRYFFCDEVTGDIWSLRLNQAGSGSGSDVILHNPEIGSAGSVASIDIDSTGELYFVSFTRGTIYKLISAAVAPTSWTVFRGVLVSGGLPQVVQSDDQRAVVGPGIVAISSESPVTLRFDATAPSQTPTTLRFFLEAQASTAGLTQVLELWDYTANAWVQVDSRAASNNVDWRIVVTPSSPARFVQASTRAMRAQVRYYQSGPVTSSHWQARVDQAVWGFYP